MAESHAELDVCAEQHRIPRIPETRSAAGEEKAESRSYVESVQAVEDSGVNEGCFTTHMKEQWSTETVRLLDNWAAWIANDRKPISPISPYPAYRLSGRGKRDGNIMPTFSIEAEKADRIISVMVPRYRIPLTLHYSWKETTRGVKSKADQCRCAIGTYYERLNEAHRMFEREWYEGTVRKAIASR